MHIKSLIQKRDAKIRLTWTGDDSPLIVHLSSYWSLVFNISYIIEASSKVHQENDLQVKSLQILAYLNACHTLTQSIVTLKARAMKLRRKAAQNFWTWLEGLPSVSFHIQVFVYLLGRHEMAAAPSLCCSLCNTRIKFGKATLVG